MRTRSKGLKRAMLVLVPVLLASGCELADWAEGGQYRPWYCSPTDTAINDGHDMSHGGHQHYTEEKGPLNAQDCLQLNIMLNRAVEYASQFPTKGDAEDNGWHWLAPWIPGQGTHHVNIERGVTAEFDPLPNMLMYDSNSDSGQLTGMVWAVQSGMMPPEGFPGDNDHWHFHEVLCYSNAPGGPFIIGDGITDEQCAARGGTNQDASDTWLLHVWLPVYEGWEATDIFNKEHPTI